MTIQAPPTLTNLDTQQGCMDAGNALHKWFMAHLTVLPGPLHAANHLCMCLDQAGRNGLTPQRAASVADAKRLFDRAWEAYAQTPPTDHAA